MLLDSRINFKYYTSESIQDLDIIPDLVTLVVKALNIIDPTPLMI